MYSSRLEVLLDVRRYSVSPLSTTVHSSNSFKTISFHSTERLSPNLSVFKCVPAQSAKAYVFVIIPPTKIVLAFFKPPPIWASSYDSPTKSVSLFCCCRRWVGGCVLHKIASVEGERSCSVEAKRRGQILLRLFEPPQCCQDPTFMQFRVLHWVHVYQTFTFYVSCGAFPLKNKGKWMESWMNLLANTAFQTIWFPFLNTVKMKIVATDYKQYY